MKLFRNILYCAASLILMSAAVSCDDSAKESGGSSTELYFFQQSFSFNVASNPEIQIPVVRLGNSGDVSVKVTASGSNLFDVPGEVTIKDGERIGNIVVSYDKAKLAFNEPYTLNLKVDGKSLYGYSDAVATIEYPTSYYEYGKGSISEGWWGEEEQKTMFARDFAADVLMCYLPGCWGHDSGPGYDVQNYVFYWNTATNRLYIPMQYMGTESGGVKWSIADRGTLTNITEKKGLKDGSKEWRDLADKFYQDNPEYVQPHYDPEKRAFYLSDTPALNPENGEIVYGSYGGQDIFRLE